MSPTTPATRRPRPVLLGVPYDLSSSFLRGAAEAPPLVRQALRSDATNTWSESLVDVAGPDGLLDAGDVAIAGREDARRAIEEAVKAIVANGDTPVLLGGDHSITYPAVRAVAGASPPFSILHVDAHPDLYDTFEGDRHSHACPFARIMEERLTARLVQVGIRAITLHQRQQAERFGVDVIDMRRWARGDRPSISGPVYVSIDLDGIDPAFAPGVAHREPGGLTPREVITLLHGLEGPIAGADVVEFNPRQDPYGLTAWVAAKLVKEIAGRAMGRPEGPY